MNGSVTSCEAGWLPSCPPPPSLMKRFGHVRSIPSGTCASWMHSHRRWRAAVSTRRRIHRVSSWVPTGTKPGLEARDAPLPVGREQAVEVGHPAQRVLGLDVQGDADAPLLPVADERGQVEVDVGHASPSPAGRAPSRGRPSTGRRRCSAPSPCATRKPAPSCGTRRDRRPSTSTRSRTSPSRAAGSGNALSAAKSTTRSSAPVSSGAEPSLLMVLPGRIQLVSAIAHGGLRVGTRCSFSTRRPSSAPRRTTRHGRDEAAASWRPARAAASRAPRPRPGRGASAGSRRRRRRGRRRSPPACAR